MAIKFDDLFVNGSVVVLSCGYWRARAKIRAVDLGVEETPAVQQALSLGFHRLVPKEMFDVITQCERDARSAVSARGMDFPLIEKGKYVPEVVMKDLVEELEKKRFEFQEATRVFLDGYEDAKDAMLPTIRDALIEASHTKEAAEAAFNRICSVYPTRAELQSKFYMGWKLYSIGGTKSGVVDDMVKEEADAAKSMLEKMVSGLRKEMGDKVESLISLVSNGKGKIPEPSIESAMRVLTRVESLNFFSDSTLNSQIQAVRNLLKTDLSESDALRPSVISDLSNVKKVLETDIKKAVEEAEKNLTGVGERKLKKK